MQPLPQNRKQFRKPHRQDLIEEIGRLYGYDKIESKLPSLPTKKGEYKGITDFRKKVSKRLRSLGLDEVRTYTLISEDENNLFNYNFHDSIKVLRPLSSDKSILRQSLIQSP